MYVLPEMRRSNYAFSYVHVHWIPSVLNYALWHSVGLFDDENLLHFDRVMFVLLLYHHSHLCHHFVNSNQSSLDQIVELAAVHVIIKNLHILLVYEKQENKRIQTKLNLKKVSMKIEMNLLNFFGTAFRSY